MITDPLSLTIAGAGAALRTGRLTCTALVRDLLERIERLNGSLGAFIEVTSQAALRQAKALDAELARGMDRGPLHGIPISIKDLFDVAGVRTTAGSGFLASSRIKRRDAVVVTALRDAGAIFLGKNNMEEFAAGMTGHNLAFGDMHNPWNTRYSAGGSSGGTAVAVAAGMCLGGIGSDTGGSVRFPASVCGLVGVRPTKRLVSMEGAVPRSASLDSAGPMARTVDDAAALLAAICRNDERVYGGRSEPSSDSAPEGDLTGLRVATVERFTFRGIEPEIDLAVHRCLDALSARGAQVASVKIPILDTLLDHQSLMNVLLYEFRQHFTETCGNSYNLEDFGPIVRSDLKKAGKITKEEYEEALSAQAGIVEEVRKIFDDVDVLLTPTQPMLPPMLAADAEVFAQARRFLLPTSFIGWPSISVPCGLFFSGLPIGLQVIGDYFHETTLLRVARVIESALWTQHRGEVDKRLS